MVLKGGTTMGRALALLALLLLAVSGYAGDYDEVLGIMESMTEAMNRYAEIVDDDSDVSEVTAANHELAAVLEEIGPRLKRIRDESPDLFQDPSDELSEAMKDNMTAQSGFNKALRIALRYANERTEDQEYQESFGRLNKAMYNM
jgi:hypothetical protein